LRSDPPLAVLCFAGTRPEAIKLAPVIHALAEQPGLSPLLVNTGQHEQLLRPILERFNLRPDHNLALMRPGQPLAELTGSLLTHMDRVIPQTEPALSLVQGDTTTAMAGALASFYRHLPVMR